MSKLERMYYIRMYIQEKEREKEAQENANKQHSGRR